MLPYLDVMVEVRDNKIVTDVYSKLTDTHQYLDNGSCHPRCVKYGIPYGQALRLRRICDSDETFEKRLKEMRGHFIKRGFKMKVLDSQFSKARKKSRESFLCQDVNSRNVKSEHKISLVMHFHPALSGVGKIINDLWPVLQSSEDMRRIFREKPVVAFRRPRNLRDSIVRSKVKRMNSSNRGMKKFRKSRCQICRFVEERNAFEGEHRSYRINFTFGCDSKEVIYLIICENCGRVYVGSTITTFRQRFNNHRSSATRYGKSQKDIPGEHLYAHFFETGHDGINDIVAKIIDKTNVKEPTRREAFWAYKLNMFTLEN